MRSFHIRQAGPHTEKDHARLILISAVFFAVLLALASYSQSAAN
jgi:hypothetical protein